MQYDNSSHFCQIINYNCSDHDILEILYKDFIEFCIQFYLSLLDIPICMIYFQNILTFNRLIPSWWTFKNIKSWFQIFPGWCCQNGKFPTPLLGSQNVRSMIPPYKKKLGIWFQIRFWGPKKEEKPVILSYKASGKTIPWFKLVTLTIREICIENSIILIWS